MTPVYFSTVLRRFSIGRVGRTEGGGQGGREGGVNGAVESEKALGDADKLLGDFASGSRGVALQRIACEKELGGSQSPFLVGCRALESQAQGEGRRGGRRWQWRFFCFEVLEETPGPARLHRQRFRAPILEGAEEEINQPTGANGLHVCGPLAKVGLRLRQIRCDRAALRLASRGRHQQGVGRV